MVDNRVKKYRLDRGLTLMQLAEKSGVSDRTISDVERGAEPRVVTAIHIARALNVTVERLWPILFCISGLPDKLSPFSCGVT